MSSAVEILRHCLGNGAFSTSPLASHAVRFSALPGTEKCVSMRKLAGAILEPNLERALAKLDSLSEAQANLAIQLDTAEEMLQTLATEPYEGDTVARIARLRKRLTAVENTLKQVSTRVEEVKVRVVATN